MNTTFDGVARAVADPVVALASVAAAMNAAFDDLVGQIGESFRDVADLLASEEAQAATVGAYATSPDPHRAAAARARMIWANAPATLSDWVAAGRSLADRIEVGTWEVADWAFLGPAKFGNRAFQFLGDGERDPDEDPTAVLRLTGKTLRNYAAVARRFPPAIAFAFPDVAPKFTIFQTLTPADLPDDFVLAVLADVQHSIDANRAWDGAPADRPRVLTRRDVRDAVALFRLNRDGPKPTPATVTATPPPFVTIGSDPVIGNPFGVNLNDGDTITIQVDAPTVVDVDAGRRAPVSIVGAWPIRTQAVDTNDGAPVIRVVLVDDAIRVAIRRAVLDLESLVAESPQAYAAELANRVIAILKTQQGGSE